MHSREFELGLLVGVVVPGNKGYATKLVQVHALTCSKEFRNISPSCKSTMKHLPSSSVMVTVMVESPKNEAGGATMPVSKRDSVPSTSSSSKILMKTGWVSPVGVPLMNVTVV